jgi:uncharacterized protein (DUF433 family)
MINYSTSQIAELYEVEPRNIIYYIQQGYLKATMVDGQYQINVKDLEKFEDEYYYNKRLKNKGNGKTLTPDEFQTLVELVEDVKKNIPFEDFLIKYGNLDIKFPSLQAVIRFKRNESIKRDKSNGMNIENLMSKYNLSKDSIEDILYRNKNKEIL